MDRPKKSVRLKRSPKASLSPSKINMEILERLVRIEESIKYIALALEEHKKTDETNFLILGNKMDAFVLDEDSWKDKFKEEMEKISSRLSRDDEIKEALAKSNKFSGGKVGALIGGIFAGAAWVLYQFVFSGVNN